MQAIILAAGEGKRLEAATNGAPKCLVEVGGRPLIEHQLEALADAGIGRVLVVVGHRADEVRKALGNRAEYIENTEPGATNSLYSFWLAREWIRGPVVVLNCDLLFHPAILDRLLDVRGSGVTYDSSFGPGREKMKVAIQDGCVDAMSKDLPYARATGENVGLLCFNEDAARAVAGHADALLREGRKKAWLAEAVERAAKDVGIRGVDIAGLPWIEIDFPADLLAARKRIWAAIERDRWQRVIRWRRTRWIAAALVVLGIFAAGHYAGTPVVDWDSVEIPDLPAAALLQANNAQRWWVMAGDAEARIGLTGPTTLRVEWRALVPPESPLARPDETGAESLCVVQVKLDGREVKLGDFRFAPDPTAAYGNLIVGDKNRTEIRIPAGSHVVGVRRVVGAAEKYLIRFREPQRVE